MREVIRMIVLSAIAISWVCSAVAQDGPKIRIEKIWESAGPYRSAYLDAKTGNIILELRRSAVEGSIRVIRPVDGKVLQTIRLEPSLEDVAKAKYDSHGTRGGYRKAKEYYESLDKTGHEYDGPPHFSPGGHFMAKLRWKFSGEKKEYEPFLQLFEMKERGYEKLWECGMHPFWRDEYVMFETGSSGKWPPIRPGTGPETFRVRVSNRRF
jgi:hypothetical protein